MKKIFFTLFIALTIITDSFSQIENVILETYYVSDSLDATDTLNNRSLPKGSKTYRIYIDLAKGSKVKNLFGDVAHPFIIESDSNFYNNNDRPTANYGYLINKGWFPGNPILGLDSWLTIGLATKTNYGVPKIYDTDGSFIGGTKNGGGSSAVPQGLLTNNDPLAGDPLTVKDGFMPNTTTFSSWFDSGIKDLSGNDTSAFGPNSSKNTFRNNNFILQQSNGIMGADTNTNIVLVAQVTTRSTIRFNLNVEIEEPALPNPFLVKYVANLAPGDENNPSIKVSPYLKYPLACGCTDKRYIEFDEKFSCSISDSCKNLVVLGCTDPNACNFDAKANYNIPSLCCYPGLCSDRDLSIVCPALSGEIDLEVYPNPTSGIINIRIPSSKEKNSYELYNAYGVIQLIKNLTPNENNILLNEDLTNFPAGMYYFKFIFNNKVIVKSFLKN
jgi:hypothetical protein